MTTVSIDGKMVPLREATREWVIEMLGRHGGPGALICVRVDITHQDVRLSLATPACFAMPVDRVHNARERRVIEAWERCGLHTGRLEADELVAFLRELEGLL